MAAAADIEDHVKATNGLQTAKDLTSGACGGIAQVLSDKDAHCNNIPYGDSQAAVLEHYESESNPSICPCLRLEILDSAHDFLGMVGDLLHPYDMESISDESDQSSQPFDIVKVRLQTTTQYPSAISAATSIFKNEGPLAFYKGTLTPLIGIGACVSVQFGGFHQARRWFEARNKEATGKGGLSYLQYYYSGAIAGIANSVISGPIEHVRIRLQTQPHGDKRLYNGPLDCARKMGKQAGGILPAIYRGEAVTIIREAQAYGMWFLSFEWMMNKHAERNKMPRDQIPAYMIAFYGGLAGEVLWLGSYPFDVVKSKMQTDGFGKQQVYKSMRDCFGQIWKKEGMGGFWKGIGPTLTRAMPVSAITFAVAELSLRALNKL